MGSTSTARKVTSADWTSPTSPASAAAAAGRPAAGLPGRHADLWARADQRRRADSVPSIRADAAVRDSRRAMARRCSPTARATATMACRSAPRAAVRPRRQRRRLRRQQRHQADRRQRGRRHVRQLYADGGWVSPAASARHADDPLDLQRPGVQGLEILARERRSPGRWRAAAPALPARAPSQPAHGRMWRWCSIRS